ncbi:hypothetical protein CC85DRAFT_142809 [Cutaneotrichosporon oleaginosum]|uniref:Secreted protein n=1 Tax=Cutaneotrichosporon oleaginosum TaxID=879819 RepID=A0A0J0XIB7_9TREE|nr:uncharacterized protein CC85DRAFT_142809 [Cutaneotrichosporon oleaginosum]KLT40757.1 hypothetical protein CC85DRAFT_142809 [Cutaneotrichosporon oleaginosum]TXT06787.1 hypothetical protein COLE_06118 [Cutaneotrichosporon oleaginosum]
MLCLAIVCARISVIIIDASLTTPPIHPTTPVMRLFHYHSHDISGLGLPQGPDRNRHGDEPCQGTSNPRASERACDSTISIDGHAVMQSCSHAVMQSCSHRFHRNIYSTPRLVLRRRTAAAARDSCTCQAFLDCLPRPSVAALLFTLLAAFSTEISRWQPTRVRMPEAGTR